MPIRRKATKIIKVSYIHAEGFVSAILWALILGQNWPKLALNYFINPVSAIQKGQSIGIGDTNILYCRIGPYRQTYCKVLEAFFAQNHGVNDKQLLMDVW